MSPKLRCKLLSALVAMKYEGSKDKATLESMLSQSGLNEDQAMKLNSWQLGAALLDVRIETPKIVYAPAPPEEVHIPKIVCLPAPPDKRVNVVPVYEPAPEPKRVNAVPVYAPAPEPKRVTLVPVYAPPEPEPEPEPKPKYEPPASPWSHDNCGDLLDKFLANKIGRQEYDLRRDRLAALFLNEPVWVALAEKKLRAL